MQFCMQRLSKTLRCKLQDGGCCSCIHLHGSCCKDCIVVIAESHLVQGEQLGLLFLQLEKKA